MNKIEGSDFHKSLVFLVSIFLVTSLLLCGTSQAKVYDDFSGTTIDSAKWNIYVNSGPTGQFSQNNGLYYSGSTGNDSTTLVSTQTIKQISGSSNCQITVQFKDFNSTTTFPSGYVGPASALGIALSLPMNNEVVHVFRGVTPLGDEIGARNQFWAMHIKDGGEVDFVSKNTSANSGQLRISFVNGVTTIFYNETLDPTTGWHQLATFTPSWGSDSPLFGLGGADSENGTTTFEIEKVSIISGFTIPLLLLLD